MFPRSCAREIDSIASWEHVQGEEYAKLLVRVDLNDDGDPEYLVIVVHPVEGLMIRGRAFHRKDGEWRSGYLNMLDPEMWSSLTDGGPPSRTDLGNTDLRADAIETLTPSPEFKRLKIGELVVEVRR